VRLAGQRHRKPAHGDSHSQGQRRSRCAIAVTKVFSLDSPVTRLHSDRVSTGIS
jgi:hypothetical protein